MSDATPGNGYALERLGEVLAAGDAIAFVGAGASSGLYPLWSDLISKLADHAVHRGLAMPADRAYWLKSTTKPQQAVRAIKQALGDSIYGQVLQEIFRPKISSDGNHYTSIHAALVQLPFRGLVTTNYDPGLLNARFDLCRDLRSTGYATWKDADLVQRWFTGEVFTQEHLPILFAHGSYERSDTIVLEAEEYSDAYSPGPYRRLFDKLWGQDKLVFVGFGFSDPWLDFVTNEVVKETRGHAAAEPRHVALVGLDESEEYTPELRRVFQYQYNATVYFYKVTRTADGQSDHTDIGRVLERFKKKKNI